MSTMLLPLLTLPFLFGEPALAAPTTPRVYGGEVVDTCAWPSVVSLPPGCTGTLIHPEIMLYAAHCTVDFDHVRFGESFDSPARTVGVDYCMVNPESDGLVNPRDYAFCKLAEPVTDVVPTPPALGCELDLLEVGDQVTIVGFGYTDGPKIYGTKREASPWITELDVDNGWMRIGGEGMTVCNGDSGGPTFFQHPDGGWRSLAIASGIGGGCGTGVGFHVMSKNAIEFVETESGIDVSPCFDPDGTWNPSEACQGLPTDLGESHGTWDDGCSGGPVTGPLESCGPAFDAPPDYAPPTVTITSPTDGAAWDEAPATVDIEIDASDAEWDVTRVYLRIDGEDQPIDDTEPPYAFSGVVFGKGEYEIEAVAEDFSGNIGVSEPVYLEVDVEPPPPDPDPDPIPDDDTGGEDDGGTDGGGTGDGGETGELDPMIDGEDAGCGCANNGRSHPVGALVLLALAGLWRRRRP
jgi:MYXO-CTERM domain-containing protein